MSNPKSKDNTSEKIFYSQSQVFITTQEQEYLDTLILTLKIIANIKEYDKVSIIEDKLSIDTPYMLQGIWRKWYGQGRTESIDYIKNVINDIFSFTDNLLTMNNKYNYTPPKPININDSTGGHYYNNSNNGFKESNSCIFSTIMINLDEAIKGIQNLKITYLGDTTVSSELDLLISKIHNRIEQIKKILIVKM